MSKFIRIVITIVILFTMTILKKIAGYMTGTATGGFWGLAALIIGFGAIFALWEKGKKTDNKKEGGDETSILQK